MTSPPNIGSRRRSPTIVALYERLVRNGQLRRHTALAWLRRHFPDDAKNHLERIVPHSEQWFSIGDRVEPAPHEIADRKSKRLNYITNALLVCRLMLEKKTTTSTPKKQTT